MKICTKKPLYDIQKWAKKWFRTNEELADNTTEVYQRVIYLFIEYISIQVDNKALSSIKNINEDFILDFIEWLEDNSEDVVQFSSSTKILYLVILKSLFRYIEKRAEHEGDGTIFTWDKEFEDILKIKKNRRGSSKLKYLDDSDIVNLLDYLSQMLEPENAKYYNYIYSFAIKMMMYGGFRVSELLNIRLKDIVFKGETFEVELTETKSNIVQYVPVREKYVLKELNYIRGHKLPNQFIFSSLTGTSRMNRSNLYRKVNSILKAAGVDKKGLHILRHTSAMLLLEKNGDVSLVKQLLRHADISTTMIYVNRSTKQLGEKIV
ncbi:MAG: Unknown protein [uncultured Sulfurovum sp.]|uniref:Uncharacterized protein n=1 Tax=uncultured Sulfurovum sp. TaxID=269237 RepID=A0A6S6SWF5_9BACT|nr:MAG: Unknown protein [uncultured Sulfurovum sp.]